MMKIKRTLVGILAMLLLIGTSFVPATKAQASDEPGTQVYNDTVYDEDGYDAEGYDSEGCDRNGYDKNGYDVFGYNVDGYNMDGKDRWGHDSSYYIPVKLIVVDDDELFADKEHVVALNADGNSIPVNDYSVSRKAITSIRKGCGTYKIVATFDKKCGNKVLEMTYTAVPSIGTMCISFVQSGFSRDSDRYNGKIKCNPILTYEASALKSCDGMQYIISKDKGFKKVYAKGTTNLKTKKSYRVVYRDGVICYSTQNRFMAKDGTTMYIKYRAYTVVGGKKLYSEWEYDTNKAEI